MQGLQYQRPCQDPWDLELYSFMCEGGQDHIGQALQANRSSYGLEYQSSLPGGRPSAGTAAAATAAASLSASVPPLDLVDMPLPQNVWPYLDLLCSLL